MGSGTVRLGLERSGVTISEATVGRLLRELDARGYTGRCAFRGRVLKAKGRERLSELEYFRAGAHPTQNLMALLVSTGKKELVDILVARRAMEGASARLAACNITEPEVLHLKAVVERHQQMTDAGEMGTEQDADFHRIILLASRNPVLVAAMELMRQHPRLSELLHYIRNKVQSAVVRDHVHILAALELHDPASSEEAMIAHIDNLIGDVNTYWTQYHEPHAGRQA